MATDSLNLDCRPGLAFSAKASDLLGTSVIPVRNSGHSAFRLLVSFSRNSFRLSIAPVGACFQAILERDASGFHISQLGHQVFRFSLHSKHVGFLCLDLRSHSCTLFELGFFPLNDSGFSRAMGFSKKDSGPSFHWEIACQKKSKYRHVGFHPGVSPDLGRPSDTAGFSQEWLTGSMTLHQAGLHP